MTQPGNGLCDSTRVQLSKPSPTEPFATDSRAQLLSRKLLLQCDRIYLEPTGLPLRIYLSVDSLPKRLVHPRV